jgi:hypothetical protein
MVQAYQQKPHIAGMATEVHITVLQNRVSLQTGSSITHCELDDNHFVVIQVIEQGMFVSVDVSGSKVHSLGKGSLGF